LPIHKNLWSGSYVLLWPGFLIVLYRRRMFIRIRGGRGRPITSA